MAIPPLNLIDPRDAVQIVRDVFGSTGEEAVRFLCDRWSSGELTPCFIAGDPPNRPDPSTVDWFTGAIILSAKWLPRQAISEPGDDPEWQRIPGQTFEFKLYRRQLEAILKSVHAAAASPVLAPTTMRHGPMPMQAASDFLQYQLQWEGILSLDEALSRL
jgi:hypothetical protein